MTPDCAIEGVHQRQLPAGAGARSLSRIARSQESPQRCDADTNADIQARATIATRRPPAPRCGSRAI